MNLNLEMAFGGLEIPTTNINKLKKLKKPFAMTFTMKRFFTIENVFARIPLDGIYYFTSQSRRLCFLTFFTRGQTVLAKIDLSCCQKKPLRIKN